MTDAERLLWKHLRNTQLHGLKFRRQQPIGNYIVDFICFENKLVVELDGSQHITNVTNDQLRTMWLENLGYRVIRFWNHDVLKNIAGVLEEISRHCSSFSTLP